MFWTVFVIVCVILGLYYQVTVLAVTAALTCSMLALVGCSQLLASRLAPLAH